MEKINEYIKKRQIFLNLRRANVKIMEEYHLEKST